jgi:hypothetical protein
MSKTLLAIFVAISATAASAHLLIQPPSAGVRRAPCPAGYEFQHGFCIGLVRISDEDIVTGDHRRLDRGEAETRRWFEAAVAHILDK